MSGVGEASLAAMIAPEIFGMAATVPTVATPLLAAGTPLVGAGMGALAPSMAAGSIGSMLSAPALLSLSGMPGITPPSFDVAAALTGVQQPSLTGISPLTAKASIMGDATLPEGVAYQGLAENPFDWMKLGKNMFNLQQSLGGNQQQQKGMGMPAPQMGEGTQMSPPQLRGNQGIQNSPYLQSLLQQRLSQLLLQRR